MPEILPTGVFQKHWAKLFFAFFSLLSTIASAQNAIVTENAITGSPSSEWDISGAGDLSIQGFATDISVNKGQTVHFKIDVTDASPFTIKIYRLGYYQGNGARFIASLGSFNGTDQPEPINDSTTGLIDCGNWSESASWAVPEDAVSGLYIAKLTKSQGGGSSHIMFIVRDDQSTSDLYFQTSDATWQAYNVYGGNSLYVGIAPFANGHAAKVSYNRPFITRNGGGGGGVAQDGPFNAEYPMIRWLERNGYDMTYTTNIDVARSGNLILKHKVFLSVGHDEYWSAQQRASVEGARNAGVNLAFFSGNEVYWKTRWENSVDGSNTPYRTLVCYKEGTLGENVCGGKCDPLEDTWTGLWRDGCSFAAADGCKPENALSGQISWDQAEAPITVPGTYKNLRFWRNTGIANLSNGQFATLTNGTIGYEYSYERPQYASSYPAGRILLSGTEINGHTHKLSLYRHPGGAWVFGAGTVQWSWGLDENHDRGNAPPSADMQQATVNLLADMKVQPASLQPGLVAATASNDDTAPSSAITSPLDGASLQNGIVTITGTATDEGTVAGVEVSVDGGATWTAASGTDSWTYAWTPSAAGNFVIKSRAFDDNGNIEAAGTAPSGNVAQVTVAAATCPCHIFQAANTPDNVNNNDGQSLEIGLRFRPNVDGYITGIRFYKATGDTGTHIGHLWTNTGTLLSFATFSGETETGWQQVNFTTPVAVAANTTYVASYFSSANFYSSTDNFFTTQIVNGPLTALADGDDGPNGVYLYTNTSAFPVNTFNSSNYWVDVTFDSAVGPDTVPPVITSTSPANNATGVKINATVSVTFNEAIDSATVNQQNFELHNGSTLVDASVSYNPATRTGTLSPSSALSFSATYTATIKGGSGSAGIKDIAGNVLAADTLWTFTTTATPVLPPTDGPGGPILIISSAANPFSRYAVEILRAQGLNEFNAMDISLVNATVLNNYDVVILGETSLTSENVTMLTDWVNSGKTLIAFKPDTKLATLLGITPAGGSLSNKYLLVNTANGPGAGIVGQTIQFHGTADQYTLNGASSLATLYSAAGTATVYPAVTINNVGANGGKAVAFTYDLARSIVYTRQGNPAWAGQKRDGQSGPIRSDDMFFPDWIDFNKIAIPQADEQQHLLTNIILQSNLHNKPLPRFWFLPRKLKAAVVMTGDDHGNNGTTGRFNHYLSLSPSNTPQAVADWTAIRGTSYIFPGTPITSASVDSFQAHGFEIGLHLNTNCDNYTPASLENDFTTQLAQLARQFPSLTPPVTHRTHCIAWSDWATKPKVEVSLGIRLNTDYYYWPEAWIHDRPGMFTGSGMPMRYADLDGTIIDDYQVTTQMTDESGISYANFIKQLLDKATGSEGYYGVFCANMHTDENGGNSSNGSDAIIAAAQARQIPVISAKQMLTWLDGRNESSFTSMSWSGNTLNFGISVAAGAHQLQAMVPVNSAAGVLSGITFDSASISYTTEVIKGINYAFFDANDGNYTASYSPDNNPPVISDVKATLNRDNTVTITWTTDELSDSKVSYGSSSSALDLDNANNSFVTNHTIVLDNLSAGTTYYFSVTSNDAANNSSTVPVAPAAPLSFIIPNICANDQTLADFNEGTISDNAVVADDSDGEVILKPAFSENFTGTTIPSGWTEGVFSAGGNTIVSNGAVTVSGTHIVTNTNFSPGSSIEFTATYNSGGFQNIGLSADQPFNDAPWVTIGQGGSPDGNLYARASDGSSVNLGANLLGSSHHYFIKWNATDFEFYVDGSSTPAATINFTINQNMYLQISDVLSNDGSLSVSQVRVTPYQTPGSFTSRVFDHGGITNWNIFTWAENSPVGTSLQMFVRSGNTPAPDSSWSDFETISNGDTVGSHSRYLQYRADLSTTDPKYTPVLEDVSISCSDGLDNSPMISNIVATPSDDGTSATITWTTNKNAGSGVDYGTSAGSLSQNISNTISVTSHSLQLTGLTPGTVYYFRVTSADSAGNSTTRPDTALSPLSFTTIIPSCFDDKTVSDFNAGTTGESTYVVTGNSGGGENSGGEVILKPAIAEEFTGNTLPATWQAANWNSGGSTITGNGSLFVNGSRAATIAAFAPGTSIEFSATFSADPFQNIGFAADFDFNSPWFAIGTGGAGDGVYARADGQADISLGSGLIGTPHQYRIDWNVNNVIFFVDGVQKATIDISISNNLVIIVSDFEDNENATAIGIDWLRIKPYASSGSFVSRVYDGGVLKNWINASWNADVPAGTSLHVFQHQGNTPVPDETWTAFSPVATPGDNIGSTSRYIQYRADLATTDNNITPVLKSVSVACYTFIPHPPVVSLTSPADSAGYVEGATIPLAAAASDPEGAISKVEFYHGSTLLHTETVAPYTFKWTNAQAGNYTLTARATDNDGLTTTSVPIHIKVVSNIPPVVTLTSPAGGSTYQASATIGLSASIYSHGGKIKAVKFYNGTTVLHTEENPPYLWNWKNVPEGNYTITAKAIDNYGRSGTSDSVQVSVVANQALTIKITSPVNEAIYIKGTPILLSADAGKSNGTIESVDFYYGCKLISTQNKAPYKVTWQQAPIGDYYLTAVATDNNGFKFTSAPVYIKIVANTPPLVNITSPADGGTYTTPAAIVLSANALAQDGPITAVEFYSGTTLLHTEHQLPYSWTWENVSAGSYVITARAIDSHSRSTMSAPVTITVNDVTLARSKQSSANTKISISDKVNVQLAPNPSHDILNIYTTGLQRNKQSAISVISSSGVIMKTKLVSNSTQTIQLNVASLTSGVYTIKIISDDKVIYKRFVKL